MTDYSNILRTTRLRSSSVAGRTVLTESESDRGRVLFCPAFRRLQQKAQVFSMEPNAAVRSRLTHSFEVSQLGRYIADEVGQRLVKLGKLDFAEQGALVNFVETACLMHDIGNPPFGHFGEAAIRNWFKLNGEQCARRALNLSSEKVHDDQLRQLSQSLADFLEFDGNPQGLRIVTRLQWNTDPFGLNLTKTTLASFLKYVRQAGTAPSGNFTKKAGYFATEKSIIDSVWQEFKYAEPQRFPLAYMMEAADDIAYCISDLEDSFEKNIVHEDLALGEIERRYLAHNFSDSNPTHIEIKAALADVRKGERNGKEFTYTDFRTSLNRSIVLYVAGHYIEQHEKVLNGTLESLLPRTEPAGAVLEVLREYCREFVYPHDSIQRIELAGYTAIRGLLDHFKLLLECSQERFAAAMEYKTKDFSGEPIIIESKLLRLFPEKYKKVYFHHLSEASERGDLAKFDEWNARAHLVVDFVSGMTDDFAMTSYRTLSGMRL